MSLFSEFWEHTSEQALNVRGSAESVANGSLCSQAGISDTFPADGSPQRHPDPGRGRRHPSHLQERAAPGVQRRRGGFSILPLSLVLCWVNWADHARAAKLVVLEAAQRRSDPTLLCIFPQNELIIFVEDLQSSHRRSAPEIFFFFCPLAILAGTGIAHVINTSPVQVVENPSQQSNHWLAVVGRPPEPLAETLNHALNNFSGILINFPSLLYPSPPFSALFLSLTLLISPFLSRSSRLRLNAASSHTPLLNSSIRLAIGYAHQASYSAQSAALIKGFPTTGCGSCVMSDLLESAED